MGYTAKDKKVQGMWGLLAFFLAWIIIIAATAFLQVGLLDTILIYLGCILVVMGGVAMASGAGPKK